MPKKEMARQSRIDEILGGVVNADYHDQASPAGTWAGARRDGSNPFPPLPAEFRGQSLGLRFSYICNPMILNSPNGVKVPIGESQQFSATLKTTGDTTVNWSISGKGCVGAACGTISATGLYRAPATLPDPPSRLRKNSSSGRFWEGHDFSRAVRSLKMSVRFSA
jgi:hypothetical protein